MKKQNGITLIALIITIVVMLILVIVTLAIAFGDNGIIKVAKNAGEKTELAMFEEEITNIALGHYDAINGWYNFPEIQREIKQKYTNASCTYYIDNMPWVSEDEIEATFSIATDHAKKIMSCEVEKGDLCVVITYDGVRAGTIESDSGSSSGQDRYLTTEEAEGLYVFNDSKTAIEEYLGNETNVVIPEVIHHVVDNEPAITTITKISQYAYCDMAHDYTHKKVINEMFDTIPVEQMTGKPRTEITVGELFQVLVAIGFMSADDSKEYEDIYELLLVTPDTDENYSENKAIINDLLMELFVKQAGGITEEYCDTDEDGDICLYKKGDSYISAKRTNRTTETITISKYIKKIGREAFGYITTLKEVTFEHEDSDFTFDTSFSYMFEGCENLETVNFPNATMETVKSKLSYYANAWGANKAVKIICSDGTINVPET